MGQILEKLTVWNNCPVLSIKPPSPHTALIWDTFKIELEFRSVRGENRSTRRKTSRSKDENQQQTQPTYDAKFQESEKCIFVEGGFSQHCTMPAPP